MELPPDAFLAALGTAQNPLAVEVAFFAVERLDVIARARSGEDGAGDGTATIESLGDGTLEGNGMWHTHLLKPGSAHHCDCLYEQ